MPSTSDLKNITNTKTLHLVLLNIVTLGVFSLMWLYKHAKALNTATRAELISEVYVITLAVVFGLAEFFEVIAWQNDVLFLYNLSNLLYFASVVMWIVWAFKARKVLQEYALNTHRIDLRMNPFYTFFLNVLYINYCINDLPELARKQEVLKGTPASPASSDQQS